MLFLFAYYIVCNQLYEKKRNKFKSTPQLSWVQSVQNNFNVSGRSYASLKYNSLIFFNS